MAKPPRYSLSGLFLVDKPKGPTSRGVLDQLQRQLEVGPLGHAGTLDPLASGLLVVLAGRTRKLQNMFMGRTKVYDASVRFGFTSQTLDAEGPITPCPTDPSQLTEEAIEALLPQFTGKIQQRPPAHSALHIEGKRAYELARSGQDVDIPLREVEIHALEILSWDPQSALLHLRVTCGPGTYIRSLARDLGEASEMGAYMSDLRRLASGAQSVEHAQTPESLSREHLVSLERIADNFPRLDVTAADWELMKQGQRVPPRDPDAASLLPEFSEANPVFGWCEDQVVCRILVEPTGLIRSNLKLKF